jgi:dihydroorotate dehydrogenase electron transfer subunit
MTAPPYHLPGLVPHARQALVPVVEQAELAKDTFRLRLRAPEMARVVRPGQFFMLRSPGVTDPLLARPFALYDTWVEQGAPAGLDLVYLVVGKMTSLMRAWKPGDAAEIWGPLGNGFPSPPAGRLILVAGGIGHTPFLAVAREALGLRRYFREERAPGEQPESAPRAGQVVLCYGVRSASYLAAVDDFRALGVDVRLATDDGTRGKRGYVTELLAEVLAAGAGSIHAGANAAVYCCGPEPMMHKAAEIARRHEVPCWVSLETPMACGFGACFSCVTRIRQTATAWDYARVCVEGPVFNAQCWVSGQERL